MVVGIGSRVLLVTGFVILCTAAAAFDSGGVGSVKLPDFCRVQVERIEEAYQAGMEKAELEADRLEAGRIRYAALAVLVELTYQSTLAWLAEQTDMQRQIRENQARWLEQRESVLAGREFLTTTSEQKLDEAAEMQLNRLRYFASITEDAGLEFLPALTAR